MTTSIPDAQRIQELTAELDRLVPTDGAFVRFEQYGGHLDESYVSGNEAGALRLGIAFLKVPFSPPMKGAGDHVRGLATDGLVPESSTIQFDHFDLRERSDSGPHPERSSPSHQMIGWGMGLTIVAALIIGFVQILRWAFALVS